MARGSTPQGYSTLQVALHWTIAGLIIFQLLVNEGMQRAFNDRMDGKLVEDGVWSLIHIVVGATILVLALVRLGVRLTRGVPAPHSDDNPTVITWVGHVTHFTLYVFIFGMPLTGIVAWFGGSEGAAEVHELGRLLLIPLISLHALGALVEHFIFRNDTLMRMLKPEGWHP